MAIRPFKRVAVTAATALSMTTLLATTAQAVPATLPHESMVTYTISPDGKVVAKADVKVNARAKDTVAPITLSGDADGVVVAAGKKTKPANYKILRAQPGYNPYQHPAPHGEDPDSEDLDLKQGFTADQLLTLYQADIPENISYTNVISGINEALKHPEVSQKNVALVLSINNNATPAQIQRALEDSNEENLSTMSDALGTHLGKIYYNLYKDGKLVKLQQLVGGNMSRGFNFTNATLIEKVSYNLKRPFYTFPQNVKYYYEDEDDFLEDDGYKGLALSYPSGHTNRAYIKGIILAAVFPEFAPQIMARASEVGYNRVVMGVHYPLDTIAGRMTGTASMAWHFADSKFYPLIAETAKETRAIIEKACGTTIMKCWAQGSPFLSEAESIRVYTERMNFGFPRIGTNKNAPMVIPATANYLLRAKYPNLTAAQRDRILLLSAMSAGYPLDITGKDGYWQRINLAKALSARVSVAQGGAMKVSFPV